MIRENMIRAYERVLSNKGAAGVDGMTVHELRDCLLVHWPDIREQLLGGTYKPQPVRRVEIPKPDGGMRKLGIPTVLDRLIQQGILGADSGMGTDVLHAQLRLSPQSQRPSSRRPGPGVHRRRPNVGGGPRSREVLRSSSSRSLDGATRFARGRQTAVAAHSGVPQRRNDGERTGQPHDGRHAAGRSAHPAYNVA